MKNADVAAAFDLIADILEFQAANPFRVRAYRNAGADDPRSVRAGRRKSWPTEPQADRYRRHRRGTGRTRSKTLVETGKLPMLEELQAQVPQSVLALLRIPGVGPKKAAVLHKELKVAIARRTATPPARRTTSEN